MSPSHAKARRRSKHRVVGALFAAFTMVAGLLATTALTAGAAPGSIAAAATGGVDISAGGPAAAPFVADEDFTGGATSATTHAITTTGLSTLANNPALCAALNRHVAQLPASEQSNPANFYQAAPANYYAEFWHENAINGKQYGFPYDDDAGQSSDISVTNPQYMVVAVGW